MHYSNNNVIVPIWNSQEPGYAILNPLTGSFDLMNELEYQIVHGFKENGTVDPENKQFYEYLLSRGYLFNNKEAENEKFETEFAKFQAEIDNSQVQLLLIPSYGCNLACTYCYEHSLSGRGKLITKETVDAFFDYIQVNFAGKKTRPFITLFGGEPLIDTPAHQEIISYIINRCAADDYEIAAVTNGYALASYVEILAKAKVKEIQVTLDGSQEVHDKRRGTVQGGGSFDRIIQGLAKAVEHHFPINLRTVVDFENVGDLIKLAEFINAKGWLDLRPELFKTQIGRNYELFDCYAKPEHLMSQVELWAEYTKLSNENSILKKFHRPDFKGIRHLVDTGTLYPASFDTCPAAKTEWVFDLYGDIYGCTASCGREELKLGSYYPEVSLNRERIAEWQNRNVLTIPECRDCSYNIICGGGCGVIAAHKNGSVLSPDCRPVQELIDIGVNYYHREIENMANPEPVFESGCVICGKELVYHEHSSLATCKICSREQLTTVTCRDGHFVCDQCHSRDILELLEQYCLQTDISDPIKLAEQIFELPGLKMHGPEYHSIVPAIIVTAHGNNTKQKNAADIHTAIERGKSIPGGVCGSHGACGAAIGVGIAYSIINSVTPLSKESRGEDNRLTAEALLAISKYGGPRCCKRETITTLELSRQSIPGFKHNPDINHQCSQFERNKDCLGSECPYFRQQGTG